MAPSSDSSRSSSSPNPSQRRALEQALLQAVRGARRTPDGRTRCPHCDSRKTIRWGRFKGRQRFRCHGCLRTFSDLTGTPLAYTKRLATWVSFAEATGRSRPVRQVARELGLNPQTVLRWRHRLLAAYDRNRWRPIGRWVGVSIQNLPVSEKDWGRNEERARVPLLGGNPAVWREVDLPDPWIRGLRTRYLSPPAGRINDWGRSLPGPERTPSRGPPRRRRGRVVGRQGTAVVHVIFLQEEPPAGSWQFLVLLGNRLTPDPKLLERALHEALWERATLVIGPGLGAPAYRSLDTFARQNPVILRQGNGELRPPDRSLRPRRPRREFLDVDTEARPLAMALTAAVDAHAMGWRRWLKRFRGVASRYLRGYLAWFRELEMACGSHPSSDPPPCDAWEWELKPARRDPPDAPEAGGEGSPRSRSTQDTSRRRSLAPGSLDPGCSARGQVQVLAWTMLLPAVRVEP